MLRLFASRGRMAAVLLGVAMMAAAATEQAVELDVGPWLAVNDGVMGGISTGEMVTIDDGLRFQGKLSLENNGGFASVRRTWEMGMPGARAVRIRVRGDGRRYQFRLRGDHAFDGIAWRRPFATTGEWQTLELPLEEFEPVWRGRRVMGAGELDPARVHQLGFMLADKQAGPFKLDIGDITILVR